MNLVLLGPPGSGKGTVAAHLERVAGLVEFDAGNVLRDRARNGTPEERERLRATLEHGATAPADLIMAIYKRWVQTHLTAGEDVLSAGVPRGDNIPYFLNDLAEGAYTCEGVLWLEAPEDVLVARLTGRRTCTDCGDIYHVISRPPRDPDHCDACGGLLAARKEDLDVEASSARWREQTSRMLVSVSALGNAGIPIIRINAMQPIEAECAEAAGAVAAIRARLSPTRTRHRV